MGWRETVKRWFGGERGAVMQPVARGTSGEVVGGAVPSGMIPEAGGSAGYQHLSNMLAIDTDRMTRYVDFELMDEYGEVSSALDLYADDATIPDTMHNQSVWALAKDRVVRDLINDLLHRRLRIEEDLWGSVRSLCRYGDLFGEVVTNEQGVLGINWMPAPTVQRLVDKRGALLGYVQDFTLSHGTNVESAEDLAKLRAEQKEDGPVYFYPWEVVHWRLMGRRLRSLYGASILEGARWVWKRLVMLEDAAIVYRLCLRGDSMVWTPSGAKRICDLSTGEEVYSQIPGGGLTRTRVLYKKHNGKDRIFRVRSHHRELFANATHPVLTERFVGNGSGKQKTFVQEYVEVQNLVPGLHRIVTPMVDDDVCAYVPLVFPETDHRARIRMECVETGIVRMQKGIRHLQQTCGVQSDRIKRFFNGSGELVLRAAVRLLQENGTSLDCLDVREDWGGARPNFPLVADEEFARWFGFMIGYGHVSERPFRKNGKSYIVREVGFSFGDDEETNLRYLNLFKAYLGVARFPRGKSKKDCVGSYVASSKEAVEFMRLNGYIPGAHNKRIPSWVFRSPESVRMAFLEGLADADGHRIPMSVGRKHKRVRFERIVLEMCNRPLIEDVRLLCMQTGLVVGNIRDRLRKGGREIVPGSGKMLEDRISYTVEFSFDRMPSSEKVLSVDEVDADDIWDIGVEAKEHNFVANGVTVHNTKSPGRFAFYVNTGDLPPREAKALVEDVRRRFQKKRMINPATGQLDLKINPLCLTGDTKVPLLDGRTLPLSEIVTRWQSGEEMWVYSSDLANGGAVVPGKIDWAGQTRKSAAIVRVVLDNGSVIRCTPDHKFPLRDGRKVPASDLAPGDSLMPFRRVRGNMARLDGLKGKLNSYEKVYNPANKKWVWTHRLVGRSVLGVERGEVVHHRDFNRFNNDPRNLARMVPGDHQALHRKAGRTGGRAVAELRKLDPVLDAKLRAVASQNMKLHGHSAKQREATRRCNIERDSGRYLREYNASAQHAADNAIRSVTMKRTWAEQRDSIRAKMILKFDDQVWDFLRKLVEENPSITREGVIDRLNAEMWDHLMEVNPAYRFSKRRGISRTVLERLMDEHGFGGLRQFKAAVHNNHKVVAVLPEAAPEDTFTLTVGGTHTFGVEAGVYVCNSQHEDFFIPTRGQQDGTRIETLAGPDYNVADDLEYFRKKLLAALHVPPQYLGGGEVTNKAALTQEDVVFARTVMRIQREYLNGLKQVVRIHLASLNIDPDSVRWSLRMTVPSSILELAQLEVMNARAGLAGSLASYFTSPWILQNVFHFSEEDALFAVDAKAAENEAISVRDAQQQADIMKRFPELAQAGMMPPMGGEAPMPEERVDRLERLLIEVHAGQEELRDAMRGVGTVQEQLRRVAQRQRNAPWEGRKR